jgi:hypothetical protein
MTKYLVLYHGGSAPASKEEGERVMKAWMDWMGSLGKSLVDGGNPTGNGRTIDSKGKVTNNGGANPATGYSILEATGEDEALRLAKGCPHLMSGGTIEVAEIQPVM